MIFSSASAARRSSRSFAVSTVVRNGRLAPSFFAQRWTERCVLQLTAPERPVPRWSTITMSWLARSGASSLRIIPV